MHTGEEIEERLRQAADHLRAISKAAKDQRALLTGEPTDVPQPPLGDTVNAPGPTIQPQG